MSVQIIQGNALDLPLADASVDLVVTSPPYFGLRSYQDGGEHYDGQIGAEATPAEFVDALIAATREMVRVVKPSGSIWVNLGDKYAGQSAQGDTQFSGQGARNGNRRSSPAKVAGISAKSLIGIPWRYALRCIDDLGLILRAEVIWSKPNGMPESVKDRVRRSHETWFHFTKEPRYYSAVDEIREAVASDNANGKTWRERAASGEVRGSRYAEHIGTDGAFKGGTLAPNPLGKLPGSVWTIPTQPLTVPADLGVDHFAAFPMEWPRRIIRGWSPPGVCTECGEGRAPIRASEKVSSRPGFNVRDQRMPGRHASGNQGREGRAGDFLVSITGYVCGCPEPTAETTPAVVLDPFGGTGTTALVAHALGRHGVSVDMSADYCRLARWRTTDPGQVAAAINMDRYGTRRPTKKQIQEYEENR